jgi:hypothetical protein
LLPPTVKTDLQSQAARERFCSLPWADVETVEMYRLYLYAGKLYSQSVIDQDYDGMGDEAHEDREWMRLAQAYLFACSVLDEKFANVVIDALIEKTDGVVREPAFIYTNPYNILMRTCRNAIRAVLPRRCTVALCPMMDCAL